MLTAKQFAQKTGVTVEKVKYWERIGFILPDSRTPDGEALYTDCLAESCIRRMKADYKGNISVR